MLSQFSDKCPNSIMETSMIPKEDVTVAWTSPPEGSGCILIRATVMETPETVYMDEGNLVKTICQDPKALYDDPGPVLPECCACDEAKYEVTFEGLWSRNTHPKDFPSKGWLIRFSDVIGASHTVDYRFWRYNETASEGLQQVAEFGSTRKLESELKDQSENIRTIIKARGISHPNVTGRTFAVFRVDRRHHLMSLVSMIVPSPDWIVGVSGLELCLSNCSWIEHKELNLYPIDAGTDDGITYMSPDAPSDPPEPIRRITSSWPNDTRSPFYDPLGMDMKPMAKLHLSRQRLYEKACNESSSPPVNSGGDNNHKNKKEHKRKRRRNKACRTTTWSNWGPCSTSCGRGTRLRQRNYKDKTAAATNNCNATLTDRGDCYSNNPECNGRDQKGTILETPACELSEWTDWSSCTTTCGDGSKTRSRNFIHKKNRKYCKSIANGPELQQTIDCENNPCESEEMERVSEIIEEDDDDENEDDDGDDEGDEYETNVMNDDVEVTEEWLQNCPSENYEEWSLWSPCSSTCGPGTKTRSRRPVSDSSEGLWECRVQSVNCTAKILSCGITPEEAEEICKEPKITGSCGMSLKRVYFNSSTNQCKFFNYGGCDGNRNNFQTVKECTNVCIDIRRGKKLTPLDTPKDYKVYLSSVLSYHIPVQNERSKKSKRDKFDSEESEDFNGIPAGSQVITTTQEYHGSGKVDCQVSEWSEWTPCNECRGYTTITRSILVPARNGGKRCPTKLIRRKKCHNLPNCSKGSRERRKRYRDRKSVWEDNGVDCKLTHWSSWSACHATCGNAVQHRTRRIQIHPYGPHGKPCTRLVEFRKCSMIPC
ncbi:spondin-1 isoform X2 [Chelonus insularis]|uniref:spondin-1 isoform X2 n=1 Tax=Chelonus insularis TaxID=460826 RepID=UPI0015887EA9|nr:spondin-1-like isoform X2 [Chelonus insularis]